MAKTYKQVGDEQERRLLADFIRGFRARSCPGRNNGCNSGTFSKENQPKGKRGRPKGSRTCSPERSRKPSSQRARPTA